MQGRALITEQMTSSTSGRSASKAGGEGLRVDCDEKADGSNVDLSLAGCEGD